MLRLGEDGIRKMAQEYPNARRKRTLEIGRIRFMASYLPLPARNKVSARGSPQQPRINFRPENVPENVTVAAVIRLQHENVLEHRRRHQFASQFSPNW